MITLYSARWVLPISSSPIEDGAVAVEGSQIAGVGKRSELTARFVEADSHHLGEAVILPGLINTHSHLELTAMRGFLEREETDFFSWLRKLTLARLERMTVDDIHVSALWGACEAARAGITCLGDAGDSGLSIMRALDETGLRGVVFQESFGPDPQLAKVNLERLRSKVAELRHCETTLVHTGVSPHAPYTVCRPQLEAIVALAESEKLPVMMHAAESAAEDLLLRDGCGIFADSLAMREIKWETAGVSTIQYLKQTGLLDLKPLLAHCIRVDEADIQTLAETGTAVAHCPKSNAKLGHGRAPFARFLEREIAMGLGSDSVASNNTCDMIDEARFAVLLSRSSAESDQFISGEQVLRVATQGGARALGLDGRVGELRQGLDADLTALSLQGVHQLPCHDPIASVVFASSGRDVVLTIVAGKEIYRDGRITTVDEDRLRARMKEIEKKLQ